MSVIKNPLSQPSLEIKPLWRPLIWDELKLTKPDANKQPTPKLVEPVTSQRSMKTRSMSCKQQYKTHINLDPALVLSGKS